MVCMLIVCSQCCHKSCIANGQWCMHVGGVHNGQLYMQYGVVQNCIYIYIYIYTYMYVVCAWNSLIRNRKLGLKEPHN